MNGLCVPLLQILQEKYEQIRGAVLSAEIASASRPEGFAIVVRNGLLSWARATINVIQSATVRSTSAVDPAGLFTAEMEELVADLILEQLEA
jgi:hypothetical protein